jgi:hypothetical protein
MIAPEPDQAFSEGTARDEPLLEPGRHLIVQNLALLFDEDAQVLGVAVALHLAPLLAKALQILDQRGAVPERLAVNGHGLIGWPDLGHQPLPGVAADTGDFTRRGAKAETIDSDHGLNRHHFIYGEGAAKSMVRERQSPHLHNQTARDTPPYGMKGL